MPIDDLIAQLEQAANGSPALDTEVAALVAPGADDVATPPTRRRSKRRSR